jgi:hypothetical protein
VVTDPSHDQEQHMATVQRSWVLRIAAGVAVLALLGAMPAARGVAQERRGRPEEGWRGREEPRPWHGDIRRFHEHDLDRWRGGHWFRGEHFGRAGWWWIVDGTWYLYPAPIYPYPDPYVPPAVVTQAPPSPATQYWYYCPGANAYYPYVAECPGGWTPVAPQPAPPGP